jgi:cytochrome c553
MQTENRAGAVRLAHAFVAAGPFVLAALILRRPELADGACPAPGEGRTGCVVQQSWVPWLTVVALAGAAVHAVGWVLLVGLPRVGRRLRRGERLRFGRPPSRRHWRADGALAAAVWAPTTQPDVQAARLATAAIDRSRSDGLAVCGRCHRSQAVRGWRAVCASCGGVALRAASRRFRPPRLVACPSPRTYRGDGSRSEVR